MQTNCFLDPIGQGFDEFFTGILPDIAGEIGQGFDDFFTDILPDAFTDLGDFVVDDIIGKCSLLIICFIN